MIDLIIFMGIYFSPTIISYCRKQRNRGGIALLNTLLGWTFVGWVIALMMAVWESKPIEEQDKK